VSHGIFQGTNGGGSDRHDPAALLEGMIDGRGGFGRDGISLLVQAVILHALYADGLEGPQPDVEGEMSGLNASLPQVFQNFRSEMQAGGGSRDRATLPRIDGLIAFVVERSIGARHVGRQGHMAELIEKLKEIVHLGKTNAPLTKFGTAHDFGHQFCRFAEENVFTDTNLSAGTDQAFPFVRVFPELPGEQNLDSAL